MRSGQVSLAFKRRSAYEWLAVVALVSLIIPCSAVAAGPTPKNVLAVFSSSRSADGEPDNLIESSVRAGAGDNINLYTIHLDYQRVADKSYRDGVAEVFRHEYGQVNLDVVTALSVEAIQFTTEYRDKLFPGVPIVFSMIDRSEMKGWNMLPGMTGLTTPVGIGATIDLALRLHPDTKAVAVIQDTVGTMHWLSVAHSELLRHQDQVKEIDILGPPSVEMLQRIAALPPHTIVLFQLAPRSSTQPALGFHDILAAAARRLPTYSAWDTLCFNYGCVGGEYTDWRKAVRSTGEIAARVLSGERPENIPIVHGSDLQARVDWRELQRWHIRESALPAGTIVDFRPPSPWEQYKWVIVGTLVVLLLLLILIAVLLTNLVRRRRAEASNKNLAGQLLHVQDEERRRMARDLHDGTAQDLTAISLCLGEVLEESSSALNGTRSLLEQAHSLSRKALQEVRSVSYALHPPILDKMGLVPALRWYFEGLRKRSSLRILLEAPPEMEPQGEIDGTLFRIVQESMSNILRHSGADSALVRLERDSHSVRMSIEDNGHGMGLEAPSSVGSEASLGVGVAGMRERVRQFGGQFEIRSGAAGTTVLVSLPVG